ncbi:hypothetical protein ACRN93_20690 [Shewanella baltica]|uniref:hypothetical protein n=1 Tax=Shewanella TaxID=22 RepID=UPI00217E6264|nr:MULTISPECIES: hypothetical protein [Shewanella]MCS6262076.1 hypothetical protein [Shewanella baltica]MCU8085308.1 hypothetical protein [Shewanella sp. SM23]
MLASSKHALLREQQYTILPLMALITDEYAVEWQICSQKLIQILNKCDANLIELDVNHLIRVLKRNVEDLKRIEKKTSAQNTNMQVLTLDGLLITEVNPNRVKRWER